jgi:phosphoserine aminotransferase
LGLFDALQQIFGETPAPRFSFSQTEAIMQPTAKPKNPNFSSGPCSKRPGYDVNSLQLDTLGRSHRSALGKQALALACSETARILGLPEGYRSASSRHRTPGAVEMALWSLLGPQPAWTCFAWESFSGLGDRHSQAAQAQADAQGLQAALRRIVDMTQVQFRPRRGVRVEWHDLAV